MKLENKILKETREILADYTDIEKLPEDSNLLTNLAFKKAKLLYNGGKEENDTDL